jgi:hypothetical protein
VIAASVVADSRDECDASAESRGCDRLVRAFASGRLLELIAWHRFACRGELWPANQVVPIRTADNNNIPLFRVHRGDLQSLGRGAMAFAARPLQTRVGFARSAELSEPPFRILRLLAFGAA